MEKKTSKSTLLLLIEAVLVFSLGIFGNKVAELLKISTTIVIFGTITLLCLLLILTLARIRYEKGEDVIPHVENENLRHLIFGKIATVFPVAIIAGIVLGFLFLSFFRGVMYPILLTQVNDYEIASLIIALILTYIISARNRELSVVLTFAFGVALGLAGIFVFLRPFQNNPFWTFPAWIIEMLLFASLINSNTFHNLIKNFLKAIQPSQNGNP